ncbi:hypothetical protein [Comamonas antarctica]|uniref:hypothetical protein n=1 Tax=Comamonas antarctica TaxID=2743470 RepID=UPI001ABA4988|nr:hypothetical protein [Comamonas antarctica]
MSDVSAVSFVSSAAQLEGLDLETALMSVQSQRANLLEAQLEGQLKEVQERNAQIGKLNEALGAARELSARFSEKDGSTKKFSELIDSESKAIEKTDSWKAEAKSIKDSFSKEELEIYNAKDFAVQDTFGKEGLERKQLLAAKLTVPDDRTVTGQGLEKLANAASAAGISFDVNNKGELEKAIENLKSMIDTQSNSQQMDMLRLQSLSNKRNEAFDTMTNFVKKMQDSRSSIIGNMR